MTSDQMYQNFQLPVEHFIIDRRNDIIDLMLDALRDGNSDSSEPNEDENKLNHKARKDTIDEEVVSWRS